MHNKFGINIKKFKCFQFFKNKSIAIKEKNYFSILNYRFVEAKA